MSLYLTPTRAQLLQDIRDGHVRRDRLATWRRYEHIETRRNLTARIAEVMVADWAKDGPLPERLTASRLVVLTDAGRSVLEEWEKSR